jgi:GTP-binding protein
LVNRILGEERMIVHDVPGTTRDSIDTRFLHGEREFVLIDTAGLRRRGKDAQGPEYYSMVRTLRAVDRCDVALVLFDASEPLTVQDLKVAALPHELWRASVFVFNKWDLVEKETMTARRYEEDLRGRLPMQDYAPVVFVSALSGQRVARIPEMIEAVHAEASKRISTGVLNGFIRTAVADNPPPYSGSGKPARIYYATQVSASPPTIILFASHPEVLGEGYLRYLTRRMREEFGFMGTPVRIRVRKPR